MSHELDYPSLIIEPEYPLFPINEPISITQTPYFYIPDMPNFIREDFKGLEFEGIQYSWNEFDYRMGVDYNPIPEPADTGFYSALIVAVVVLLCLIRTRIKW